MVVNELRDHDSMVVFSPGPRHWRKFFLSSAASVRPEETPSQTRTMRHLPWKQTLSGSRLIAITRGFRSFAGGTRSIERLRSMRMPGHEHPQRSCPADRGPSRGRSLSHRRLARVAAFLV